MKKYRVTVNGTVYEVELEELTGSAPVSAPAALNDVAVLGGEAGAHHVVDLTGHAVEALGQIAALDLQHAVRRLIEALL